MKWNLKMKDEEKTTITFQIYKSDKIAFDKYLETHPLSMSNVLRSHINDLLEGKATLET